MKKQYLYILFAAGLAGTAAAQAPTDSIRARIKQIKLSENYFYAEATSGAKEEAREVSIEELHISIAEQLSRENRTKEEIAAVRTKVDQQYRNLEYRNGPMYKSFAYIDKGSVTGGPAPQEPEEEAPAVPPAEEAGAVAAEVPAVPVEPPGIIDPKTPEEASYIAEELPEEEALPTAEDAAAEEPTPAPAVEEKRKEGMDSLPETHRRVVDDILKAGTYEGLMMYLDGMKEDGRLMYGRVSTLVSPEQAYLIVVKEGRVVTVLNRGRGSRTNLRSGEDDTARNYRGHAVIWLKIF